MLFENIGKRLHGSIDISLSYWEYTGLGNNAQYYHASQFGEMEAVLTKHKNEGIVL